MGAHQTHYSSSLFFTQRRNMELMYAAMAACGVLWAAVKVGNGVMGARRRRPLHMESLKGKHVVITGGSSGIGLAIALRCAEEGAFLTLISRSSAKLAAARDRIVAAVSCSPESVQIEVADTSDSNSIIAAITDSFEWKPIDVLICNAGVAVAGMMGDVKISDLDLVMKTNFMGCVYPVHAAIPLMKQRSVHNPSSIVIMSSLAGLVSLYGVNVYSPTKYALKALAELLRLELQPWKIRINLVCPSFTKTDLLEEEYFGGNETIRAIGSKLYRYNHKDLESPDKVALKTIEGVKTGEFLVFTNQQGASLGPLTRGLQPSESFGTFIIEWLLMFPFRIYSHFWFHDAKNFVRKMTFESVQ